MSETLLKEVRGGAVVLTLNRPEKLNCINWAMIGALEASLEELEADPPRLLCVRGSGGRAFSSGGDLNEFRNLDPVSTMRWIRRGQSLFERLEALPALTIALIEGYALGGGLELALACDLRIAAPSAVFSCPEMRHGWLPGWGALKRLGRLVGEAGAKELVFLGDRIDAGEARRIGLVNRIVPAEDFFSVVEELGENLSRIDPALIAYAKSALSVSAHPARAGTVEGDVLATLLARRES